MRRAIIVALGLLLFPASASAITIHRHETVTVGHHRIVGRSPDGLIVQRWTTQREISVPVDVPPADADQDGIADSVDPCIGTCAPAAPTASSSSSTATATSSTSSSGYAIPASIVQCESGGSATAVNPSSGAGGLYQIMPSTWQAYGGTGAPQDAPVAEQSAIAAKIWAASGPAAWSCAG